MAKKCTKKRDARAKLLFCQSQNPLFFAVLVAVVVVPKRHDEHLLSFHIGDPRTE